MLYERHQPPAKRGKVMGKTVAKTGGWLLIKVVKNELLPFMQKIISALKILSSLLYICALDIFILVFLATNSLK